MLDKLTSATFLAHLNETFLIHYDSDEPWETTLVDVSELDQMRGGGEGLNAIQAFSIIFRSPHKHEYLPQSIYTIQHDALGKLELFLVPVGPDEHGMRYEAVFT